MIAKHLASRRVLPVRSFGRFVCYVGWDGFRLKINCLPYARVSRERGWHLFLCIGFNGGVGSPHITMCPCVVMRYVDGILHVYYWLFAFVFFVR